MYDLFISFATKDGSETATELSERIEKERGLTTHVAHKQNSTSDIPTAMRTAIENSHAVIVILTPEAFTADGVEAEVRYAKENGKRIFLCVSHKAEEAIKTGLIEVKEPFDGPPFGPPHHPFKTVDDLMDILANATEVNWRMPVVIPCAGEGSGLLPFSVGMPKTLFPIRQKPILHHIIDYLDPKCFSKVIILAGRFEGIVEYYVNELLKPDLPVEVKGPREPSPDATNTLPEAITSLGIDTRFMIHFSDIVIGDPMDGTHQSNDPVEPIPWNDITSGHKRNVERKRILGTLLTSSNHQLDVGRITPIATGNQKLIKKFEEKPAQLINGSVNIAVSIFEPEFLTHIDPDKDISLYGHSVANAIEKKELFAYYDIEKWLHIQTLSDWYRIQNEYFDSIQNSHNP